MKVLSLRRNGEAFVHVAAAEEHKEWIQHASWQMPPDVLAMVCLQDGLLQTNTFHNKLCSCIPVSIFLYLAQAVDEVASKAAVGCIGTELSIWDLETQQRSYLAKGAKPNRIGALLSLKVAN